jgi:DNA-binding NtrC family response regulator
MTRIAVINDDAVLLDMMTTALGEKGWNVDNYRESTTAYQALKQNPPELIILDIRMETPEAGWNVLELLTLDHEMSRIPVIVCSAAVFDLRAHEQWLTENGIGILPKPFNLDQLYDKVETALGSSRRN